MTEFTIYPAIDLRNGKVVRLAQGDPARQVQYSDDPAAIAYRWLSAGSYWLHVVNLDGAFGEDSRATIRALHQILEITPEFDGLVQFGGGLRSFAAIEAALVAGARRVVLGTAAIEDPTLLQQALQRFGTERIAVGIDSRNGKVRVRGWLEESALSPLELGKKLVTWGVRTVIFTNISRDGVGTGVDSSASRELMLSTGLEVVASGGVNTLEDVRACRTAGLPGVIIGRALYEGAFTLQEALQC